MSAAIGQIGTGQHLNGFNPLTTGAVNTNETGSNFVAIVWIGIATEPTLTITDNFGNEYTQIGSTINNGSGVNGLINRYQVVNGVGGAGHTLTVTSTGNPTAIAVALVEMTGCNTAAPLDQSAVGIQGVHANPVTSGSVTITPPSSGEILIAPAVVDDGGADVTFTEANGFDIAFSFGNFGNATTQGALGIKIVTAPGTYNASWSAGDLDWATAIDSFKGAASTGVALAGAASDTTSATGALMAPPAPFAPILLDNPSHAGGSTQINMGTGPDTGTGDNLDVAFLKVKQDLADINTMMGQLFPSRSVQSPTTGFTIAAAAGVTKLILNPAGTLATGAVTLPPNPGDQQPFVAATSQTVTAFTANTSDGTTLNGAPGTLAANTSVKWVFEDALNTWFREQ